MVGDRTVIQLRISIADPPSPRLWRDKLRIYNNGANYSYLNPLARHSEATAAVPRAKPDIFHHVPRA